MVYEYNINLSSSEGRIEEYEAASSDFSKVKVNTATKDEILTIPGLGEKMAEFLCMHRKTGLITEAALSKTPGFTENHLQYMDFAVDGAATSEECHPHLGALMKVIRQQEQKLSYHKKLLDQRGNDDTPARLDCHPPPTSNQNGLDEQSVTISREEFETLLKAAKQVQQTKVSDSIEIKPLPNLKGLSGNEGLAMPTLQPTELPGIDPATILGNVVEPHQQHVTQKIPIEYQRHFDLQNINRNVPQNVQVNHENLPRRNRNEPQRLPEQGGREMVNRKIIPKDLLFEGRPNSLPWNIFRARFNRFLREYEIDTPQTQLFFLGECLKSKAGEFFEQAIESRPFHTLDEAMQYVGSRFDLQEHADVALLRLQSIKQGSRDAQTFAEEVWETAYKAFPNSGHRERERQAVNHFMWGLADDTARSTIACHQPSSMKDALKLAVVYQHSKVRGVTPAIRETSVDQQSEGKRLKNDQQPQETGSLPLVQEEFSARAVPQVNPSPSQRFSKLEAGMDSLSRLMNNMTRGQMEQTKILKAIQESLSNNTQKYKQPYRQNRPLQSQNNFPPQTQDQRRYRPREPQHQRAGYSNNSYRQRERMPDHRARQLIPVEGEEDFADSEEGAFGEQDEGQLYHPNY